MKPVVLAYASVCFMIMDWLSSGPSWTTIIFGVCALLLWVAGKLDEVFEQPDKERDR